MASSPPPDDGAHAMIQPNEPKNGIAIELTPLIDMVFLLLIFFLVATTFHQTEREMQIALPAAASAGPISTALREIVINVDRTTAYLNIVRVLDICKAAGIQEPYLDTVLGESAVP
jgi:biopolymer transport protein ExbD